MRKIFFAIPLMAAIPLLAHDGSHATPASKAKAAKPAMAAAGPSTAKITSGTYSVESTHALIGWRVNHFGFNDYFGIFGNPTGKLTLDKTNPSNSKVKIEVPIKELYTASAKLTGHLLSKEFFDTETHPTAKFKSTKIMATGTSATIQGNLTMLGITKPVVLRAKLSGSGTNNFNKKETVGFHATSQIKRSDWGMGYGVPMVGENVELDISVAFEKD